MNKDLSNESIDLADEDVALKILDVFNEKFSINLKDLHSFLFRRRLALAFKSQNISMNEFIFDNNVLSHENADRMLYTFFPDHSELFRDIETWLILRDKVLKILCKKKIVHVFFPFAITGEEIYSLLILLKEFYPENNYKLKVNSRSSWALHRISNGYLVKPKNRLSLANFKLLCDKSEMSVYLEKVKNTYCFKRELLNNVNFEKYNNEDFIDTEMYDLIICRNKTLSYKHEKAIKIITKTIDQVNENGVVIFGINENIPNSLMSGFQTISWSEKIFQRKAHEK